MKKLLMIAGALAVLSTPAAAVEIEVGYPYSHLFDVTYKKIMQDFSKKYPDIKVKFRATYENYEDATNTVLREAASHTLPDVTMQGLNRQRVLVEKGIAKPMSSYIAKEQGFEKRGYHKAMLSLSTFKGKVYGLPMAVSLPVGYYNMDLLKKAGITSLPKTWDDVVDACKVLSAKGVKMPMFWGWNITGNWFLQALMWSQGEPIMKGNRFNMDGKAGLTALETMKKLFRGCNMPNMTYKEALQAFSAGDFAMMYWSTSAVGSVERNKGDFTLKTAPFPGIGRKPEGLPAGGNAAMLVSESKDPERLQAAWTFIKFITSGVGAAAVAETTGYMPPNKDANEVILADFYKKNPNKATAVNELPLLRDWIAYPGDKGLAITQEIYDATEAIVIGDEDDMKAAQEDLMERVTPLLPKMM